MKSPPTLLGTVGAVSSATVSVRQSPGLASGIAIIGGKSYRIGQVGSFVRIPQGYHDLYGIVSEVGANATPKALVEPRDRGDRWMTVQLVGEIAGGSFERGIGQYPSVNDEVHLVTEDDLARIYGTEDGGQVVIGRLASAEGLPVRIDLNKLVTRHSAILGSTGSGKSTTVASLLRSIATGNSDTGETGFPRARILLLDIHGEYGRALGSVAEVFRVTPGPGEQRLHVPYWALDPSDLLDFLMGQLNDGQMTQILDRIMEFRTERAKQAALAGVDLSSMNAETPVPYSLKRLWLALLEPEVMTLESLVTRVPAKISDGDAEKLIPPKYKPHSSNNTAPFINNLGVLSIRRQLEQLRSRLLDRRYDFLLHPGLWEPDLNGVVKKDLGDLLETWLGHHKPITILDLSGIPSVVLVRLIGTILSLVLEGLFWGREKSEGGVQRPMLIVMEEAHRYLSGKPGGPACELVQRIVKEGRKFGIGAMVVSQRPSEVDETILSQCGTFVSLRLSNSSDRQRVQAALPDNLSGVTESLPVLRTGEAVITGEAARLPIRCRIALPAEENRPNSQDPDVAGEWRKASIPESYDRVAASWRAQNPRWTSIRPSRTPVPAEEVERMEREQVASSTIVSIGYDATSQTLEVEFKSGGTYQYYNVPPNVHEGFMQAGSKGQYLHVHIKNSFACSRV